MIKNRNLLLAAGLGLSLLTAPMLSQAQEASQSQTSQYMSDAALTAKVKTALLAEKGLKSTDISVSSEHGTVQLSGFVVSSAQIDQAVDLTRHVKGVQDVKNDLRLKTSVQ